MLVQRREKGGIVGISCHKNVHILLQTLAYLL